ncbi:hypothetical protein JRO89_XS04G0167600 [Xanthoceras sorbifolium]|uniref:TRUD domain-containing protein n=1 Tax=Xanthoceras sorbifolium TaxID=99658 RepID=A0ABQ8I5L6_9ROSI|nr:hypothetical protein JRO89_XS04G0167600 [Xanthoceras sorbifolium]
MWRNPAAVSCLSSVALKPYLFVCNCNYRRFNFNRTLTTTTSLMKSIDETDVGIFCYISNLPGFRGVLKQRYSDFIVNEVDTDGNVVHLTCLDAPPEAVAVVERTETKGSDQMNKSYDAEIELFRSLASDSDAERLEALIGQITSGNSEDSISPIVLSANSDKSHRTAIHNFFKENLKFLVTDTVDGPDASSKCIRVRLHSGGNSSRGRNSKKRKERGDKPFDSRGSENWPEHLGKFLRFHLYKENKDTQEALGLIGKMLGIQPRSFGFAGTKDKRSVSTQGVTVFKQHVSRLAALNKRLIGIQVGDFCYVKEGLMLGQLLGNRFSVTLRGVVADSEDVIKGAANSLGSHGFINYFGLQRFGSGSVPTHLVGATLLRGEWKTALQCLKKCPGNYLQALKAIPRTLRMMYVHSYQSYLWNHAASMRVQKYGIEQVVVGDLVYCKGDDTEKVMEGVNAVCDNDDCNETYDSNTLDEVSGTDLPEERHKLVKTVTAEDINARNYTIDEVILPMPGSRVIYPMNDVANVYHDLAKKDAINLTESVHNVKEFSITAMTGSYRRVFQKPMDFEWELLRYTDGNKPLAETDLDKIAKARPVDIVKELESTNGNEEKELFECTKQSESVKNNVERSTDNSEVDCGREVRVTQEEFLDGSNSQEAQLALKMGLTLPASCYATMAIRELLKTSTSVCCLPQDIKLVSTLLLVEI